MLVVKDPKRLKAFGFTEADLKNSGYIYKKYATADADDAAVYIKPDGGIEICSSEMILSHVLDTIFDLIAANLVVRVPDDA